MDLRGGLRGTLRSWLVLPELLAAYASVSVLVLAGVARGLFPFGPLTRSVNDLGTQLVPLHARYRDVLTGQADGDLLLNWSSGLGVPFLPDVMTYLSSPFSLLVVLFPRDQVDLALVVVAAAKLAVAAAAMTGYLRRLHPGPPLVAAGLGAAYATCGWALSDAIWLVMWLDGLIALPLLGLVTEWARRGIRPVLAPLVVALAFTSNYYTAYMATIGAGLLLLVQLVATAPGWRPALVTIARAARALLLGAALTGVLLAPTFWAVRASQPSPPGTFDRAPWQDLAARLLPASEGLGSSPGLYLATPVLLLALSLPWCGRVPRRVRLVMTVGVLLVVASLQWLPTHVVWHAFDTPNGSPYRQAFVVVGFVVVAAWTALSRGWPSLPALAGGGTTLAVLVALAWGSETENLTTLTRSTLVLGVVVAVAVVPFVRRPGGARLVGAALLGVVVLQGTATSVAADREHRDIGFGELAVWDDRASLTRDVAQHADRWPQTRTMVRTTRLPNDGLLLGGQSMTYYSSLMPASTSHTFQQLGVTWSGYGRAFYAPDTTVSRLVGIGQVVDGRVAAPEVAAAGAAPLVSVRPPVEQSSDPFESRNSLAGAAVYTTPDVEVTGADGRPLEVTRSRYQLPATAPDQPVQGLARCPVGSEVHLWAPGLPGGAVLEGGAEVPLGFAGRGPGVVMANGVADLGPVGADGVVRLRLTSSTESSLPLSPVGCFDPELFDGAMTQLQESAAEVEVGGHGFTAMWERPVSGTVVALVPSVSGWVCDDGSGWASAASPSGWLSVEVSQTRRVECSFRPRWLRLGLLLSAAGALGIVAVGFLARRGDHRSAAPR
jgi:uncharacterized membrane protein YfhO